VARRIDKESGQAPDRERMLFLSDAHLGEGGLEEELRKEEVLLSFLRSLDPWQDRLVICGDLFDFWYEYKYVVAAEHFRVIAVLAEQVEKGLAVDYVAGNHDFWMRDFFPKRLGIPVHRHAATLQHGTLRIYASHGDGLRRDDRGYRLLKRVLQNRVNIALFRWVHPDLGYAFAHWVAGLSRKRDAHPYRELDDSDYIRHADSLLASGYDVVVLAHTHKRRLLQREKGIFLNPGEWLSEFTFGELRGNVASLKKWLFESGRAGRAETLETLPVRARTEVSL
jgi:UDP-2,3-diacylglucosamine hydrolase